MAGLSNYERLIALAEETFAVKSDPGQLDVNEEVMNRLRQIHPHCISSHNNDDGPVAWVLLIPTTSELMYAFVMGTISEKELFEKTPTNASYDALYLCSALVLEEYRRQGIVYDLATTAIEAMRKDHPLETLFVWPFSREGLNAAKKIAGQFDLPLLVRQSGKVL